MEQATPTVDAKRRTSRRSDRPWLYSNHIVTDTWAGCLQPAAHVSRGRFTSITCQRKHELGGWDREHMCHVQHTDGGTQRVTQAQQGQLDIIDSGDGREEKTKENPPSVSRHGVYFSANLSFTLSHPSRSLQAPRLARLLKERRDYSPVGIVMTFIHLHKKHPHACACAYKSAGVSKRTLLPLGQSLLRGCQRACADSRHAEVQTTWVMGLRMYRHVRYRQRCRTLAYSTQGTWTNTSVGKD